MAFEIPGRKITRVCGAASLAAKKFYFVKLHTDGTAIVPAADTDVPYGILQNNPDVGGEAEVMRDGVSKVVAGTAIVIGNLVGTSSAGKAMVYVNGSDTTKYIVGTALSAGGDTEIITVDFSCVTPNRGT
jgi:hypothetical protein